MAKNLILSLLLVLAACGGGEETAAAPAAEPAAAPAPAPEPPPFDAKQTFTMVCGTCHGTTGLGDGPAGAALDPKPASFADAAFWVGKDKAAIAKVIKEGGAAVGKSPVMVGYGAQFNDEQIGELADIVMGYKPAGEAPAAGDAPAEAPAAK